MATIVLTDVGIGVSRTFVTLEESQIVSVSALPFDPGGEGSIVTMENGIWYRVEESPSDIEQLREAVRSSNG